MFRLFIRFDEKFPGKDVKLFALAIIDFEGTPPLVVFNGCQKGGLLDFVRRSNGQVLPGMGFFGSKVNLY